MKKARLRLNGHHLATKHQGSVLEIYHLPKTFCKAMP